jgi:hypothetical protein
MPRLTNTDLISWNVILLKYINNFCKHWLVFNVNLDDILYIHTPKSLPAFYRDVNNVLGIFGNIRNSQYGVINT